MPCISRSQIKILDSPPTEETFQNVLATEDHCLIQGVTCIVNTVSTGITDTADNSN